MAQETLRRNPGVSTRNGLSPAAALVRQHDRDRFQTALFAPADAREALFALYAFNYEIARVRETVREPMLGQIRLQWWREAIDAAYGEAVPRRHDIVEAITAAIRSRRLSRTHFERLIDAREQDIAAEPPATLAAMQDYAEASSVPLILLALEVLDAVTPATTEAAGHVGIAYALSGILRALPYAVPAAPLPLPMDMMPGVDAATARSAPVVRDAVTTIAAKAASHLSAARKRRVELPRRAFPALLPARIAARVLKRLERSGFDPFVPGISDRDPLQPWRLALALLLRRL